MNTGNASDREILAQAIESERNYNAAQKETEAAYPVGTILTAPNGEFAVVRIEQHTVVLQNTSGQEQGIAKKIIDAAIERGTMGRK